MRFVSTYFAVLRLRDIKANGRLVYQAKPAVIVSFNLFVIDSVMALFARDFRKIIFPFWLRQGFPAGVHLPI